MDIGTLKKFGLFAVVFYFGGWFGSWVNTQAGVANMGGLLGPAVGFLIPVGIIYVVWTKYIRKVAEQ